MPVTITSRINVNFEKPKLFAISGAQRRATLTAKIAIGRCPAVKKAETALGALLENHYSGIAVTALPSAF